MNLSITPAILTEFHSKKIITDDEYTAILKDFVNKKIDIFQVLLSFELLNESDVIPLIALQLKISHVQLKKINIDSNVLSKAPAKIAYHYGFIPLSFNNNSLEIAFSNPFDIEILDEIKTLLDVNIYVTLAGRKDIKDALKRIYGIGADTVQKMIDNSEEKYIDLTVHTDKDIENLSEDASIIKFVNQVISEAVKERATDIHIEPYEKELKIRYRIDGILYDAPFPTTIIHFHNPIISRFKIMSNLNISERRLPQDGRLKVKIKNKELDLRISILPTPWGEAAGIRLLSGANDFLELKDIGLYEHELNQINKAISMPYGMFLVTGPTGSGKTTTLYACLNRLNTRDKKIITIEDPIEYLINNITQLQVNPSINFNFSTGLRSMLRHDPDVMMIGEIRDNETAEIAIQAALTGHIVFSTLHTNDSASTITRMIDIGIEHFLLSSSLQCVIAQRLVRVLCKECKQEEYISPEIRSTLLDFPKDIERIYKPIGCNKCNYTGYRGRIGIFEIISIDENIRELIQSKSNSETIRKYCLNHGTMPLRKSGFMKLRDGITSLEEVLRVTADNH